jgi:hypothetical protein
VSLPVPPIARSLPFDPTIASSPLPPISCKAS